jgi:transcriptional pleiotropic regulator of transition state genes
MRNCGIVRKIDTLGRIVIAKELRDTLNLPEGTPMEIYTEGENIILKKYKRGCTICGDVQEDMTRFKGKELCECCITDLRSSEIVFSD